ncbi:hypothetical protein [Nostoc sp.]
MTTLLQLAHHTKRYSTYPIDDLAPWYFDKACSSYNLRYLLSLGVSNAVADKITLQVTEVDFSGTNTWSF